MRDGSNQGGRGLRSARLAVTGIFFLNGFAIASWFVRIPAVQERLGLGEGLLGVALLGAALGAIVAMPATGWLVSRFGSRPVVGVAALLLFAALLLPALAPRPVNRGLPRTGFRYLGCKAGGSHVLILFPSATRHAA